MLPSCRSFWRDLEANPEMDVKTFVQEALEQIIEGVVNAQESECGSVINAWMFTAEGPAQRRSRSSAPACRRIA